ncbi:Guanine-specific ribonuclease N1/T1 [Macrophomina phaseolina MS6]|uniref:Guanine-specific ribonuclease N1/T1 n=1 Tax=Macrophomina phaseolina (strain MS6) TaxID=1126212 RepID=K2RFH8_MACPH|nr:Guanine-specific ribonuclease N1/T1 [Macrophomina phaseolina MS6]
MKHSTGRLLGPYMRSCCHKSKLEYVLPSLHSLLEPCAFPSYAAILGSWYGPSQLAKRMALSEQSRGTPGMFSGFLQTGLYTGLNGTASVAGWRWLFIFDGIISIPIELWEFFAIPDLPSNTRTFYLTAEARPSERVPNFTQN